MNTLIFANIPYDCHEDELRSWIEERGFTVTALRLIRDEVSRSSPAFAQIRLTSAVLVQTAIERLNRRELRGRTLSVTPESVLPRRWSE